jgi:hypothetical protein
MAWIRPGRKIANYSISGSIDGKKLIICFINDNKINIKRLILNKYTQNIDLSLKFSY